MTTESRIGTGLIRRFPRPAKRKAKASCRQNDRTRSRPVGGPEATRNPGRSRSAQRTQMPGQRSSGTTVPLNPQVPIGFTGKISPYNANKGGPGASTSGNVADGEQVLSRISYLRNARFASLHSSMRLRLGTRPLSRRCEIGRAGCILPPIVVPPRKTSPLQIATVPTDDLRSAHRGLKALR